MSNLRKRWPWLLVAVLALGIVLGAWALLARRGWRVIGHYPCARPPVATASGVLCTTSPMLYGSIVPETLSLRGWDGRVRWTITIPQGDARAFRRWYPGQPPETDGSRWRSSPDGRTIAVVLYEPAGGRILIWRDGKLLGDHHFPVRHGTLFDGKNPVDLSVLNDGRVFAHSDAYPTGAITLFRDGRLAASGRHQARIKRDSEDPFFVRSVTAAGVLESTVSGCARDRCMLAVEITRITTSGTTLRCTPISKRSDKGYDRYLLPANLTTAGTRLRVTALATGRIWLLPAGISASGKRLVVSPNGRFVLHCSEMQPPLWQRWPILLRVPGFDRLPASRPRSCWTLYEDPGVVRASGWIGCDEGESGVFLIEVSDRTFNLHDAHLSPDGRILVAYDVGTLYYLQIR